jgi:aminotransferase
MKNVSCVMPESTFYVFPDISKTGVKSAEFSAKLGEQEKIRGAAGASYGPTGEGHIRLALVEPLNVLVEAMDRFERFVNKL